MASSSSSSSAAAAAASASTSNEKFNIQTQLEHLQMKTVGTGHSDTTQHEWLTNQHRDTYASFIGHAPLLQYLSVASNDSIGRIKYDLLTKMIRPCGPPPAPAQDDDADD